MVKKDRGRPIDPKARPKEFGEVSVASDVPGLELLQEDVSMSDGSDDEVHTCVEENEGEDEENASVENDEEGMLSEEEDEDEGEEEDGKDDQSEDDHDIDDDDIEGDNVDGHLDDEDDGDDDNTNNNVDTDEERDEKSKAQKRKFLDYVGQLNAADTSLRALKKLAGTKVEMVPSDTADGILSNEDFQRIKELKVLFLEIDGLFSEITNI